MLVNCIYQKPESVRFFDEQVLDNDVSCFICDSRARGDKQML